MRKIDVSIVVPAHNEAKRIGSLLSDLYTTMNSLPYSYEIIVSEDGSNDGTDLVVQKYSNRHPEVRHLHHDKRLGKGEALICGFKACKGNILIMIDSDGAYFPSDIPRLIEKIYEDVDCAIGSRALEDSTLITSPSTIFTLLKRHIAGVLFNYLVRTLFSIDIRDTQAGLKVFKREVIDAIIEKLSTTGFEIDAEILMRAKQAGFKIIEVPITFQYLKNPKINILTDGLKMGIGILRVRFLDNYRGHTPPKAYVDAVKHFLIQKKVAEKSHRNLYCSKNPFKRFLHNIRRKTVSTLVNTNAFTLEVGCGDGYILSKLKNAIGVDLVPLRAKRAKSLTRKEVIVADAENLPFKQDAFQCIVATEVLEHLQDPVKALFEIERVAENNSDLIITIPNERNFHIACFFMMQKPNNIAHFHSLNEKFLQSLFPLKFKHNLPINLPFHLSLHHCGVYINRKSALKNSNNWCLD